MRLNRTFVTGMICTAWLASAAPAQAKSDSHGKSQRCVAAQNGKHNGFTCDTGSGVVRGRCPDGYFAVAVAFDPAADVNGNGVVCQSMTDESWVDDDPRGN
jgi:hypothetical protein